MRTGESGAQMALEINRTILCNDKQDGRFVSVIHSPGPLPYGLDRPLESVDFGRENSGWRCDASRTARARM